MNADDLKKRTTESLKELAALLEQGRSERLTSLLTTMARFHRYSLHNICVIVSQRPTATRVAGFLRVTIIHEGTGDADTGCDRPGGRRHRR